MSDPKTKTELMKTHKNELVKQYISYDIINREEIIYTANLDAAHGDACIATQYAYRTGTSLQILKRKEFYSTWDSAWDI